MSGRAATILSREDYEAGGWTDGRLGQASDLIAAILTERGVQTFRNPLLDQIEALDEETSHVAA